MKIGIPFGNNPNVLASFGRLGERSQDIIYNKISLSMLLEIVEGDDCAFATVHSLLKCGDRSQFDIHSAPCLASNGVCAL